MKIHARRPRRSRSPDQSEDAARSFADNRAGARQFSRLQAMADGSPRALGTMQLKKLVNNKLNVVGEDHDESGKRRDEEKAVSSRDAGGKYWTEGEFRARPRSFGEALFGESSDEGRAFADPLYLRIAHRVQFLGKFNLLDKTLDAWDQGSEDKGKEVIALGTQVLAGMETQLIEMRTLIGLALKNEEKNSYTDKQAELLNAINTELKGVVIPKFLKLEEAWKTIVPLNALPKAAVDLEKEFHAGVDSLMKDAEALGGTDLGKTRELRSQAMDQSGTARKTDKGVWKIGDAHFGDIEQMVGRKEYNLISRQEFNDEYKSLPILVGDKMVKR
jgi:hypothetical protein